MAYCPNCNASVETEGELCEECKNKPMQTQAQPQSQTQQEVNPDWPSKSKVAAGVLGILLGAFGVHKFYLGKIGFGILYLVFFWTGIPTIIGLIEGIIYLTTSDAEFQIKHQVRIVH